MSCLEAVRMLTDELGEREAGATKTKAPARTTAEVDTAARNAPLKRLRMVHAKQARRERDYYCVLCSRAEGKEMRRNPRGSRIHGTHRTSVTAPPLLVCSWPGVSSTTDRPPLDHLFFRARVFHVARGAAVLRRMQRDDTSAQVGVIQNNEQNMLRKTTRRPGGGRRRWTLLTPTVLWSVVILAMAPSLYGFAGGLNSRPAGTWAGRSGVEAADLPGPSGGSKGLAGSTVAAGARGSPFVAASWLKERVRDGKRRVQMQVSACFFGVPGRWVTLLVVYSIPDTSVDTCIRPF